MRWSFFQPFAQKKDVEAMTKQQWRKRKEQWKRFNAWEHRLASRNRLTPHEAFRIFDTLYKEARDLGALTRWASLDGLEAEFRIAAILNRKPRSGQ